MVRKSTYPRTKPSKQCPYLLELTPETHYTNASEKIVENVLINRFGKKNIPQCVWWRQSDPDTPTAIHGAQKFLRPVIKRLLKTYTEEVVMAMISLRNVKFLNAKQIPRYLFWCKQVQDNLKKLEKTEDFRYNKEEKLEDKPVIDIDKKKEDDLLDWLDN